MMAGAGRGCVLPGYLDIYWDIEEALFIRIAEKLDAFFGEFESVVRQYLDSEGVIYDDREVSEVMRYQRLRIPRSLGRQPRSSFCTMFPSISTICSAPIPFRSHANGSGWSRGRSTIKATKAGS